MSKCLFCGVEFQQKNKRHRFCTRSCRLKEKYQRDINYKLTNKYRRIIWRGLKGKASDSLIKELIDCDVKKLKSYLRKRFKKGMSFDNYGEWHVDHIIPCSTFNLHLLEEKDKCFHYTNLQPLWSQDNIRKSNN